MHLAFKSAVFALAAALLGAAAPAAASSLLTVSSYDMPNGDGNGNGGNYWDTGCSNCLSTNCTTGGAALSGGTGLLTDGVIPNQSYDSGSGIGAYVGWLQSPTITFHFGSTQTVNEVKLYMDNSAISGISAPQSLTIDSGTPFPAIASMSGP